MKKLKWFGGFVALIFLLWGGMHVYHLYLYTPRVNPKPKYFINVKGEINTKISKKIKLMWVITYRSTNKSCARTINWFEGVTIPRITKIKINAMPNKVGQYHQKIYLDRYRPGDCQWQPMNISYKLFLNGKEVNTILNDIVFDNSSKKPLKNSQRMNWVCSNNKCHLTSLKLMKKNSRVPANENYAYIVNVT
jgi:hypothetical protein